MNKIVITSVLIFIASIANAGDYICYDKDGLITSKHYSVSAKPDGTCIKVSREEFKQLNSYKKVDTSVFDVSELQDSKIVDMTQIEIDAIEQARLAAEEQAETDRINALDDSISKVNTSDISLTKVDGVIDKIGSLEDAKVFLKKLCRYIVAGQ